MAICDDTKRIRTLITGWPGAVNDQRIFDMSPLHDDDFWDDRGGMEGMLATMDRLRSSNAADRRRYEEETGTALDGLGYQQREEDLERDDSVREMLRDGAERTGYKSFLEM
ncbi:hypothetical protein QFC21_007343 [Naganishia friedmannii]|uniref:Uncharacterized protein n=1 Tax=Naganishia friedmannii TaxID=89922 RepID=A0ACC2UVH5_9TREE|nr:hypothetical protein QFC21_007343 [Naganishia friedmannii]